MNGPIDFLKKKLEKYYEKDDELDIAMKPDPTAITSINPKQDQPRPVVTVHEIKMRNLNLNLLTIPETPNDEIQTNCRQFMSISNRQLFVLIDPPSIHSSCHDRIHSISFFDCIRSVSIHPRKGESIYPSPDLRATFPSNGANQGGRRNTM